MVIYNYTGKKFSFDKRGVKKQNFFCQGGSIVSGRRGESDFALQEGVTVPFPPSCPRVYLIYFANVGPYLSVVCGPAIQLIKIIIRINSYVSITVQFHLQQVKQVYLVQQPVILQVQMVPFVSLK